MPGGRQTDPRPQRESLRYVSQLLWPDDEEMQKMDIDASKMDEEWASRPDEVLEYCVRIQYCLWTYWRK